MPGASSPMQNIRHSRERPDTVLSVVFHEQGTGIPDSAHPSLYLWLFGITRILTTGPCSGDIQVPAITFPTTLAGNSDRDTGKARGAKPLTEQ